MPIQHWIFKTEPSEFSFEDLLARGRTTWDGISNPLALRHLRSASVGDPVLIYHTGKERTAVGLARVVGAPSVRARRGAASEVVAELEPVAALPRPVSLQAIKANPKLKGMDLLRLPRLSVVPVRPEHWEILLEMSGSGRPRS